MPQRPPRDLPARAPFGGLLGYFGDYFIDWIV